MEEDWCDPIVLGGPFGGARKRPFCPLFVVCAEPLLYHHVWGGIWGGADMGFRRWLGQALAEFCQSCRLWRVRYARKGKCGYGYIAAQRNNPELMVYRVHWCACFVSRIAGLWPWVPACVSWCRMLHSSTYIRMGGILYSPTGAAARTMRGCAHNERHWQNSASESTVTCHVSQGMASGRYKGIGRIVPVGGV